MPRFRITAFRNGRAAVLVATDVAARGLGTLISREILESSAEGV